MPSIDTIEKAIKAPVNNAFRRFLIKRRDEITGEFEDTWQDLSDKVKKWGKVRAAIDSERINKFRFSTMSLKCLNDRGTFNPADDKDSFWFGFGEQQRSLVRIEAGFFSDTQSSGGVWARSELPSNAKWDDAMWDVDIWDADNALFTGILWGDIELDESNEVKLRVKPLSQVFRDYSARNLSGYNNSLTASDFMRLVRDHTDGSGNFIFRPFFGNTTANFEIASTTVTFSNLNTATAKDVRNATVWDVMEKLAEAENHVVYVDKQGVFKFQPRDAAQSTTVYELHGVGSTDNQFGHTVKRINRFGKRLTKFYSRVELQFQEGDTVTSFKVKESSLAVSGANTAWNLGERTLSINNVWIPDSATADTIATTVFNEVSSFNNEIELSASFVPHLDVLDRFSVTYDSSEFDQGSLWDVNVWADSAGGTNFDNELVWDESGGNALRLDGTEFKFLEFEQDLDKLETTFKGKVV